MTLPPPPIALCLAIAAQQAVGLVLAGQFQASGLRESLIRNEGGHRDLQCSDAGKTPTVMMTPLTLDDSAKAPAIHL